MANRAIEKIKKLAEQLYIVRKEVQDIEEETKKKLAPLKSARTNLQAQLIEMLDEIGIKSIKTESGESYSKAERKGASIVDVRKALAWARENGAVSIDKRMAEQKLKALLKNGKELPEGFEIATSSYITVRKPSKK